MARPSLKRFLKSCTKNKAVVWWWPTVLTDPNLQCTKMVRTLILSSIQWQPQAALALATVSKIHDIYLCGVQFKFSYGLVSSLLPFHFLQQISLIYGITKQFKMTALYGCKLLHFIQTSHELLLNLVSKFIRKCFLQIWKYNVPPSSPPPQPKKKPKNFQTVRMLSKNINKEVHSITQIHIYHIKRKPVVTTQPASKQNNQANSHTYIITQMHMYILLIKNSGEDSSPFPP